MASAETPGDVVLCQLVSGTGKNLFGCADFDQITEVKVGSTLGNT